MHARSLIVQYLLPPEAPAGETHDTGSAIESWIIPTVKALESMGWTCVRVSSIPASGLLLAVNYSLAGQSIPKAVFVVAIIADGFPDSRASVTVVQNRSQAPFCPNPCFIPHWPQPDLQRRNAQRADRVEVAAYFGDPHNLPPEIRQLPLSGISQAGVRFNLKPPSEWHDYSDTDVVIAIRDRRGPWMGCKPATKLYNAWLAGVPAIVGNESAYLDEGTDGLDFLVAESGKRMVEHLRTLRDNPGLYRVLRRRASERSEEHGFQSRAVAWDSLMGNVAEFYSSGSDRSKAASADRNFAYWSYRIFRKWGNHLPGADSIVRCFVKSRNLLPVK
jgi:hypothetical protein